MVKPAETLCSAHLDFNYSRHPKKNHCPGEIRQMAVRVGSENRKSLRPSKGRRLESFRGTTLIHPPCGEPRAPFTRADGRSYHLSSVYRRTLFSPRKLQAKAGNRGNSGKIGSHRGGSKASSPCFLTGSHQAPALCRGRERLLLLVTAFIDLRPIIEKTPDGCQGFSQSFQYCSWDKTKFNRADTPPAPCLPRGRSLRKGRSKPRPYGFLGDGPGPR
jgi:hypothetical protein